MAANIQVTVRDSPGGSVVGSVTAGASRDDLRNGYEVTLYSVDSATTYTWSLEYTPDSPSGATNSAALSSTSSRTATFDVSLEGSYLVKLIVDEGLGTEDDQTVRLRYLTEFADLKLPAAGERRDGTGSVPSDAEVVGWSDDQNENLQKLLAMVRRCSESGRVLFVDANKGRDYSADANDEDNTFTLPGAIAAAVADSGLASKAKGFGEFSTVTDAFAWAAGASGRGEPALSATDPYTIFVRTGLYIEDLDIPDSVVLVGLGPPARAGLQGGGTPFTLGGPVIRTATSAGHVREGSSFVAAFLANVLLENTISSTEPVFNVKEGICIMHNVGIMQKGTLTTQGPALGQIAGSGTFCFLEATECSFATVANDNDANSAYVIDHPAGGSHFIRSEFDGRTCLSLNPSLYDGPETILYDCSIEALEGYGIRTSGDLQLHRCDVSAENADKGILVDNHGSGTHPGSVSVQINHTTLSRCNILYDHSVFTSLSLDLGSVVFMGGGSEGLSQTSIQKLAVGGGGTDPQAKTSAHSVGYIYDFTTLGPGGKTAVPPEAQAASGSTALQAVLDNAFRRIGSGKMAYFNAAADLNLNTSDGSGIVGVSTGTGAFTITLPGSSAVEEGAQVVIKDIDGNAAANNITVDTFSGTIDGVASKTISTNYGVFRAFWDGSNWFTI